MLGVKEVIPGKRWKLKTEELIEISQRKRGPIAFYFRAEMERH